MDGIEMIGATKSQLLKMRGARIGMIFQEPMTSLNPVFTIGFQIAEAVMLHQGLSKKGAMDKAAEMLDLVGIPLPRQRVKEYPHQLSGGMRQRVMIAMALSCNPQVLIADEPTTALDVTVQAQILELLARLQDELGMAILLITHDLAVVAEVAERVAVMYAGQVVECTQTESLFADPRHPYTKGLLKAIPRLDEERDRLEVIDGAVPDFRQLPSGCRFHPRCPLATDLCREAAPPLEELFSGHQVSDFKSAGHFVACWRADD